MPISSARPKFSVYIAASIDGYIARADGGLDWLERVNCTGENYNHTQFFDSIDGLILGRNTYDIVITAPEWPYAGKRTVVLSSTLKSVVPQAELYNGDIAQLISRLHADGIKHVWVDGGATIAEFLKLGLVDTLILSTIPILLGSGIPLFRVMDKDIDCRLISSEAFKSGLVQTKYALGAV